MNHGKHTERPNMKRFLLLLPVIALISIFAAGCARRIIVAEVLQQPKSAPIYTSCNIWYSDPADIPSLNIQKGRILPIGSEVTADFADEFNLVLRDKAGQIYHINFEPGVHLCGMRDYIRNVLSLRPLDEQLKEVRPNAAEYIRRGEIVPGMTRKEVLLAYGLPPGCRTPSLLNETWIYWSGPDQTFRIIFRSDKVRNIVNINP